MGLVAVLALREGMSIPLGTARRMGPGYLPMLLGIVLMALSVLILLLPERRSEPEPETAFPLRGLLAVVGAMVAFALLLPIAGLFPAIVALVFVAALADPTARPLGTAVIAGALGLLSVAIFVWGLGLPLRPFRLPVG